MTGYEAALFVAAFIATLSIILMFAWPQVLRQMIRKRLNVFPSTVTKRRLTEDALKRKTSERLWKIVDKLDLKAKLADEKTYVSLRSAGFRGDHPLYLFLFMRLFLPLMALILFGVVISFASIFREWSFFSKLFGCIIGAYIGFYLPIIYIKVRTRKRLASISKAWPDALDLTTICVEAGMTIELAFRKVAEEIGVQSMALAQELATTVAELSIMPDRKKAYDNLVLRVSLPEVRPIAQALSQAERYGTPVGQALRTLSKEARESRVMEAERKAAALPPKLTVPMIVFFLPVLFAFILGPAIIRLTQ